MAVDVSAGHLYWTNMGNPKANDGSVFRADIDGSNMTKIIAPGGIFTPKQLQSMNPTASSTGRPRRHARDARQSRRLARSRRSSIQARATLVPEQDQQKWCVGVAIDADGGKLYWTQKGGDNAGEGRILRTNLEMPKGQTPANRSDIELLYEKLPEPIDLDLDPREPAALLDRPGRPAARQHGEPRTAWRRRRAGGRRPRSSFPT